MIDTKLVQPLNVSVPIEVKPVPKSAIYKLVHCWNAPEAFAP